MRSSATGWIRCSKRSVHRRVFTAWGYAGREYVAAPSSCQAENSVKTGLILAAFAVLSASKKMFQERRMDEKIVQEIMHELFSSLERLDTQNSAILQFLKDKGIARDEELTPYMEQASNAANVRWLAVRVRIDHLASGAIKSAEKSAQHEAPKAVEKTTGENPEARPDEKESRKTEGRAGSATDQSSASDKAPAKSAEKTVPRSNWNETKQADSSRKNPEENAA
jgi:hypothetical protein